MADIGWLSLAEAETYMATRYGASDVWVSGADKTGALQTAYLMLLASPKYALDTTTTVTADMQNAQCEQALFLLRGAGAVDARADLRAQDVTDAGFVMEEYNFEKPASLPIAPLADAMLAAAGYKTSAALRVPRMSRSEEG